MSFGIHIASLKMNVFQILKSLERGGFKVLINNDYRSVDTKQARKLIILHQDFSRNCWMATLDDDFFAGPSTLPTAFTLQMEALEVRKRIEALNPDCIVAVVENIRSTPNKAFLNFEKLGR